MILRIDLWGTELPPPSDPDPNGAAAVQELIGGRFGEMSTFMNYTFQSFNFRNKQGARPFYDLVANIAAEEFGHIELVAATINTMLTGASPTSNGDGSIEAMDGLKDARNTQQFIAGGHAALPQDSNGRPWTGDNVFSSGDLVEDLTHNFFLRDGRPSEQAARLRDGRPPGRQGAHGYLLVRGGVHQIAYARDREPDRREADEDVPGPGSRPTRSPNARRTSSAATTSASTASRLTTIRRSGRYSTASIRRRVKLEVVDGPPEGAAERPAATAEAFVPGLPPGGDRRDRGTAADRRRPAEGAHRERERAGQLTQGSWMSAAITRRSSPPSRARRRSGCRRSRVGAHAPRCASP